MTTNILTDQGPHVGDVGTTYRITVVDSDSVAVDISTYSELEISFKLPDGTIVERLTADGVTLTGDGTDGQYEYTAQNTDTIHDSAGRMDVQGKVTFVDGSVYSTQTIRVLIHSAIT